MILTILVCYTQENYLNLFLQDTSELTDTVYNFILLKLASIKKQTRRNKIWNQDTKDVEVEKLQGKLVK